MITANDHSGDKRGVVVWDLRTRRELRTFEVASLPVPPPILPAGEDPGPVRYEPAHFKWSHDDSYVARRGKDKNGSDIVSIYELPSMALLGKRSLRADGVREFHWSPSANKLAFWSPEADNTPARVTLVEMPSRKELRQKNITSCHGHQALLAPARQVLVYQGHHPHEIPKDVVPLL